MIKCINKEKASAGDRRGLFTIPVQTCNDARQEQLREQQYRNSQKKMYYTPPIKKDTPSDPLDSHWLADAARKEQRAAVGARRNGCKEILGKSRDFSLAPFLTMW